MTQLAATASIHMMPWANCHGSAHRKVSDLIARLEAVDLLGRQMFERDNLSFSFECWFNSQIGEPSAETGLISALDVFTDIKDIYALPALHPEEVSALNPAFQQIVEEIERYVRAQFCAVQ